MDKMLLKDLADIQVGYQTRSRIEEIPDGTHYLVQGKDFDAHDRLQINQLLSFIPKRNADHYSVSKGDILFQARGVEHFAYCVTEALTNTLAASSFYIIRPKSEVVLPAYLSWWLNQSPAQNFLRTQAGATAISFVSKSVIAELPVELPPLSIQQKVAHIIELWERELVLRDRLAESRARLIQALCMKPVREQGERNRSQGG